jgi:hypothetical protein
VILHTVELATQIGDQGVYVNRRQGDAVDVSGELYVALHDGFVLRRATGWHESRAAALLEAADRLQGWALRLHEQAEKLRREAAQ